MSRSDALNPKETVDFFLPLGLIRYGPYRVTQASSQYAGDPDVCISDSTLLSSSLTYTSSLTDTIPNDLTNRSERRLYTDHILIVNPSLCVPKALDSSSRLFNDSLNVITMVNETTRTPWRSSWKHEG